VEGAPGRPRKKYLVDLDSILIWSLKLSLVDHVSHPELGRCRVKTGPTNPEKLVFPLWKNRINGMKSVDPRSMKGNFDDCH